MIPSRRVLDRRHHAAPPVLACEGAGGQDGSRGRSHSLHTNRRLADAEQVGWYLSRIGKLEARQAAERMLADLLPSAPRRVLDLGCGDGRLTALVVKERPSIEQAVAVDRSEPMLTHARDRFADDTRVEIRDWDLNDDITPLGTFDVIVSGFAIHHLEHRRKRALFR